MKHDKCKKQWSLSDCLTLDFLLGDHGTWLWHHTANMIHYQSFWKIVFICCREYGFSAGNVFILFPSVGHHSEVLTLQAAPYHCCSILCI